MTLRIIFSPALSTLFPLFLVFLLFFNLRKCRKNLKFLISTKDSLYEAAAVRVMSEYQFFLKK